MASTVPKPFGPNRRNPWRARVKIDRVEYFLGAFPTRAAAEAAEAEFREAQGVRKPAVKENA